MRRNAAGAWALIGTVFGTACGGTDSTGPTDITPPAGDAVAGQVTFQGVCAQCHASRDGYDIAYFDFTADDIIRRAVAHVDSTEARNVVAYIRSLPVVHHSRYVRLFQPQGRLLQTDEAFWEGLFGTSGWPASLTAEALRSLDLRDVAVPIPFPVWSSEPDASDWMPEVPLPQEALDANGGALQGALDAYYASRTDATLLAAIAAFDDASGLGSADPDKVCAGHVDAHVHPDACFEARRWMSSLAALHYLRRDAMRDIPHEVARLWWQTGEAAVSVYFLGSGMKRTSVAAWLYLGSIFAPDGFLDPGSILAEDAGYMGQFLQSASMARLAALVTLRRLVSQGPIHQDRPEQAYWDLRLASSRAPADMVQDVLTFGLEFLLGEQQAGRFPPPEHLSLVEGMLANTWEDYQVLVSRGAIIDDGGIKPLLDEVVAGLEPVAATP